MKYVQKQHQHDATRESVDQLAQLEEAFAPSDFDDFTLSGRIEELVNGSWHGDSFRPSKSELATSIINTIASQFATGTPSPEAIRYVADRFSTYMNSMAGIDSLDAAFFLESKNLRGGQARSEADELEVCQAYEALLMSRTRHYDAKTKTMEILPVTREIRREAEQMATEAHYGKSIARLEYWEGKFNRTVKPILQKHGVIEKKSKTHED